MRHKVDFSREAASVYKAFNDKMQRRIRRARDLLSENPFAGKKLTGDLKGYFSYRVGSYRILYIIDTNEKKVYIAAIGHRKDVYRT